ncbi:AMMECR1 domain-containing protein [Obelidium mucronatum]|nr:AMMECR1 domain-containing protein [Obelidium mucronatum]
MDTINIEAACLFCFATIDSHLTNVNPSKAALLSQALAPYPAYPLFVTWKKNSNLRGCIGTFSPQKPLLSTLQTYSIQSAFKDHRFSPISLPELSSLEVGVSLLVNFEAAPGGYLDWTIGLHGIWIEFQCEGEASARTATYLPEVAAEQGWTQREALDSLLKKGGFRGRITEDIRQGVKVTRYQSLKHRVSWSEYKAWLDKET